MVTDNYFAEAAAALSRAPWYRGSNTKSLRALTGQGYEHAQGSMCLLTAVNYSWWKHTSSSRRQAVYDAIAAAIAEIDPEWVPSQAGGVVLRSSLIYWNDYRARYKKDVVAVLRRAGEMYAETEAE
jgi:hypothetical protein